MLFGSLVKLHTWLHSCLCFSPLKKLFLKSWLDTSSIDSYLSSFPKLFLIAILTTPQHLVDQSRKFLTSQQASFLLLVDWSSIILASGVFLPRHFICRRCFFSTPTQQMAWHHLNTSSVENYWWSLNTPRTIRSSLLSISLLIFQTFHLPNLSHSLQTSSLGILKLSSSLSSLGKLLISFIYMHFMF